MRPALAGTSILGWLTSPFYLAYFVYFFCLFVCFLKHRQLTFFESEIKLFQLFGETQMYVFDPQVSLWWCLFLVNTFKMRGNINLQRGTENHWGHGRLQDIWKFYSRDYTCERAGTESSDWYSSLYNGTVLTISTSYLILTYKKYLYQLIWCICISVHVCCVQLTVVIDGLWYHRLQRIELPCRESDGGLEAKPDWI